MLFDEVKVGWQWLKGPVVANYLGHWDTEGLALITRWINHDLTQPKETQP